MSFPALGAGLLNLRRDLIGPFDFVRVLRLAREIAFVLVFGHSKNRSTIFATIMLLFISSCKSTCVPLKVRPTSIFFW